MDKLTKEQLAELRRLSEYDKCRPIEVSVNAAALRALLDDHRERGRAMRLGCEDLDGAEKNSEQSWEHFDACALETLSDVARRRG